MSITKTKRDRIREEIIAVEFLLRSDIDTILKKHLAPGLKPASAKNKGRAAQKWLRLRVLGLMQYDIGKHVPTDHVRSTSMGAFGEDLLLSPKAREYFPFAPECKNTEKVGFWPTVDQAEANAGKHIPLILFMKNRTKPWIAIPASWFFRILAALLHEMNDYYYDHLHAVINDIEEQIYEDPS